MVLLEELMFDTGLSTGSLNQSSLFELEHTLKDVCQGSNTDTYGAGKPAGKLYFCTQFNSAPLPQVLWDLSACPFSRSLNSDILT